MTIDLAPDREQDAPAAIAPPYDLDAEHAVLGAALLTPAVLPVVTGDLGLRPEHFYRAGHQRIFAAMLALLDRGEGVDHVTVSGVLADRGELDGVGGKAYVDGLATYAIAPGNARDHARRVKAEAAWRSKLEAARLMEAAVADRDADAFATAEAALNSVGQQQGRSFTPAELTDRLWRRLQSKEKLERFPWPFRELNVLSGGGVARGQVTVIAGPTSHGKSALVDQALDSMAVGEGVRAHLFINEMPEAERIARVVGRRANVSWEAVYNQTLTDRQADKVGEFMRTGGMRFGMTEAHSWTARDICREQRRRRYDIVCVDLVNKLPYRGANRVSELEDASAQFNALALETNCAVLLVAHLNRNRVGGDGRRPLPTLTDIKGCQALVDDAPNALFVWREQDEETGDALDEGFIRLQKVRGGQTGGLAVSFNGAVMRFDAVESR